MIFLYEISVFYFIDFCHNIIISFLLCTLGLIFFHFFSFFGVEADVTDLRSSFLILVFSIIYFLWTMTSEAFHKFWYAEFDFHWVQVPYWDSFYGPECGLPWQMIHVHLKRIWILFLGGMIYKCQLAQAGGVVYVFYILVDFLTTYINYQERVKFPTIIMDLLVSSYNLISFLLMYFEPLFLDPLNIKDCNVFLTHLPFYNYEMTLFTPHNTPGFDIYFDKI